MPKKSPQERALLQQIKSVGWQDIDYFCKTPVMENPWIPDRDFNWDLHGKWPPCFGLGLEDRLGKTCTAYQLEIDNRQRLLAGMAFDFPTWVREYSAALILAGSKRQVTTNLEPGAHDGL